MFSFRAKIASRFGWRCIEFGAIVKGNIRLGKGVFVASGAEIVAGKNERVEIGDDSFIHRGVLLYPYGGKIRIGKNVGINPYCVIYGHGGVEIGDDVLIATSCVIIPANHRRERLDLPIRSQGLICKGIKIENNVWLGARSVVLDGVKIGEGAVVGAGSVVSRDIPPNSIAVGVPAKVIRMRTEKDSTFKIN